MDPSKKLFGTDGIRGVAGEHPLDDRTVYATGKALGETLREFSSDPTVLVGMDTRESGPRLAGLLAAGLEDHGAGVTFAGVITTPGVAYLTAQKHFSAGVMISASHNSFEDNGIKIFGPAGYKLPDQEEKRIESIIFQLLRDDLAPRQAKLSVDAKACKQYLQYLRGIRRESTAAALPRTVVDCANGAASWLAPRLFESLNVPADFIGADPDGRNINSDCGSLHLDALRARVIETGADLGIAFDGDADRALFVTQDGQAVNGDLVLLLAGEYLAERDRLTNNVVVTTVMANLGLEIALKERGIQMVRTPVGDKYVLEEMVRRDAALGGEQSGHIIFREFATTGDGLLTAFMMLEILVSSGCTLGELAKKLKVFPQTIKNVRVRDKPPIEEVPLLARAIAASERELGEQGRVVVRYSGTEPLARIMVEAEEDAQVEQHSSRLARLFEQQLGA